MTRFFSFVFIDESEVKPDTNWIIKSESINADGVIYAVIPHSEDSIKKLKEILLTTSRKCDRYIFILPNHFTSIDETTHEYEAVSYLRESASDDPVLFDEYDVIYEDLHEVISNFMSIYTHPEKYKASYIFNGRICNIRRKAALTELMSDICDDVYALTPVICNEAVNRDVITNIANNSRSKLVSALLRNQLEPNLGLSGTGQEVSIMRSTLLRTGVLVEQGEMPLLDLRPNDSNLANMLETIENFVLSSRHNEQIGFDVLYDMLTLPEHHIGLRKGLIPIYLAVVLHEYKQQVLILDKFGQVPTSADILLQINADPNAFSLSYIDWNPEKESFVEQLTQTFANHIIDAEKGANTYDYIANAMRRWVMSLPKYAKEIKCQPNRKKIDGRHLSLLKLLKHNTSSYELLFNKLPKAYGYTGTFSAGLAENIIASKNFIDRLIPDLKKSLIAQTKEIFMLPKNEAQAKKMSLASTIQEWCDSLNPSVFNRIFADGTDKCLALFRTVTNDEDSFIVRLAKASTGLRIEDWDDSTFNTFTHKLKQYRQTAQNYEKEIVHENADSSNYKITFVNADGSTITKCFERVAYSNRGKLLYNQITQSLDSMGHALSEQEKRQIIMEILQKLC